MIAPLALANTPDVSVAQMRSRLIGAASHLGIHPRVRAQDTDEAVRAEFAYAISPSISAEVTDLPLDSGRDVMATPEQAYARLHAILRGHARYTGPQRPGRSELRVRVTVSADAYRDMYPQLRESPAWRFERAVIEDAHAPGSWTPGDPNDPDERYWTGVMTRMRALFGDQALSVEFATILARSLDMEASWVALAAQAFGMPFSLSLAPPDVIGQGRVARWVGGPSDGPSSLPQYPTTHHLFGPDRCEHAEHHWRGWFHPYRPYLSLSCRICLRDMIALRPWVERPDGSAERIVAEHQAQQILMGERPTEDTEAILATANAIPADAAAYAITRDLRANDRASSRRTAPARTLREVMQRR